jgi:serine protease Do
VAGAGDDGVIVVGVGPSSSAAESGLASGDLILDVGRRAVNDPAEVVGMVDEARAKSGHPILLRIKRGDPVSRLAVHVG